MNNMLKCTSCGKPTLTIKLLDLKNELRGKRLVEAVFIKGLWDSKGGDSL